MKWFREVSKLCLTLIAVAFAVFIFGFASNPQWKWWFLPVGLVNVILLFVISWYFWRKGGDD